MYGFHSYSQRPYSTIKTSSPAKYPGLGGSDKYTYVPAYQKQEEKVKRARTDLDRINNVIKETERKKALAERSRKIAAENRAIKRALELEEKERELIQELSRLLTIRLELIHKLRAEEELLILMIVAKKRRLKNNLQIKWSAIKWT